MATLSWLTARAEIATIITGVAITAPVSATILKVFETQPAEVPGDMPCVIILGAEKSLDRSSALRRREYIAHLRLVVEDADLGRAADILDAFQEAINDRFDANVTLNGKVTGLVGPDWELPDAATQSDVGGQSRQAVDGKVTFFMYDDPAFAA